jgi:hypothetical protein
MSLYTGEGRRGGGRTFGEGVFDVWQYARLVYGLTSAGAFIRDLGDPGVGGPEPRSSPSPSDLSAAPSRPITGLDLQFSKSYRVGFPPW